MQMLKRSKYALLNFSFLSVLIFLMFVVVTPVRADVTYGFYSITNNIDSDAAIGEAQLFVDVVDYGNNQVLFRFRNEGPSASSITAVYFADGSLFGIASVDNSCTTSTGGYVAFTQDDLDSVSPPNLPGWETVTPTFKTTAGFSADSNPPVQPNGVNPGEWLGIVFNLQTGKTYSDVETELANGNLRIGIHVQGFTSGGSESFINTPIPASVLLLGSGLIGLVGFRKKKIVK